MGWNVEGEGDLSGAYTDTDTDKSRRARTGSFTFPSSNPHSPSYGAWTSHRIGGSTGRRSSASTSASVGSLEVVVEEREEEEEENDGRGVVGLEGTDDEDRDMGMWEDKQGWRGEGEGEGEEVMLEEADIGVAIRMEDCVRVEVK